MAPFFGVFAALLQLCGYASYLYKMLRGEILPNRLSWLMFAYGTLLLILLEAERGASWDILLLPGVCALSSIAVALACWRQRGKRVRLSRADLWVFCLDLLLTFGYVLAWLLLSYGIIHEEERRGTDLFILFLWNIGIFSAFTPLFLGVRKNPEYEHPLPWIFWTSAYLCLVLATWIQQEPLELFFYPTCNAIAHLSIAWLSTQTRAKLKI